MAPPPYQKLYDDIEHGVELSDRSSGDEGSSDSEPAHDLPFLSRYRFRTPFFSSESHRYLPLKPLPAQLTKRRWLFALPLLMFCLSTGYIFKYSSNPDELFSSVDEITSYFPISSLLLWPRPGNADDQPSLQYYAIPFPAPASPVPQSPPTQYPSEILETLLNPSSLPGHAVESGAPLSQEAQIFFSVPTKFDVVWTWVNGSDPLQNEAMSRAEEARIAAKNNHGKPRSGAPYAPPSKRELELALESRQKSAPKLFR